MLHPGVTQVWVGDGELPREQIKNQRWRRPDDVLAEATHGEVVVRVHHTRIWVNWKLHFGVRHSKKKGYEFKE
ncbi:hypothetical protein BHE74_00059469 [Ensete ventricosum]|nr:hypothetical protein BHE74_00059469 [Ensete ventricosum]